MEVEAARCECCGFTEECTPEYIAAVRAEYLGRWVCGLCAEAVGDEVRRCAGSAGERAITKAEALDRHGAFARQAPRPPGSKAAEELVAAVSRLLRRCLDSTTASPAAPQGRHGRWPPGPGARTRRMLDRPAGRRRAKVLEG